MVVVSDTSPILNLLAINRLDLLETLYPSVIIPPAVQAELSALAQKENRFRAAGSGTYPRVQTLPVPAKRLADQFRRQVDPGEAEALALAIELRADLLLVDERAARRLAVQYGLRVRGLLGVLVLAKRRGLLPALAPLLDRLINQAGFYIGARLRTEVLRSVAESDR